MHRILMIAFSLFTVFNLFAAGPDTAIAPANIDKKIADGIQAHRVEAFVADGIHQITSKYDTELNILMDARDSFVEKTSSQIKARLLGTYAQSLIKSILKDLWSLTDLPDAYNSIRALSFARKEFESFCTSNGVKDEFNPYIFFKLCTQSFYHSKTLLGITLIPEIISLATGIPTEQFIPQSIEKKYISGAVEQLVLPAAMSNDTTSGNGNFSNMIRSLNRTGKYYFSYTNYLEPMAPTYTAIILPKQKGGQFGGCISLTKDNQKLGKYFVKAYYGYPAKGSLNSLAAFHKVTISKTTYDDAEEPKEAPYKPVDLKELFVYKVLELIGLGPKVHFLINPYLKDGIFIITEDLNTDNTEFVEIGKMPDGLKTFVNPYVLKMRNGNLSPSVYESFDAVTSMLEIDTINRIFHLTDANDGNFGYMGRKIEDEIIEDEDTAKDWLKTRHDFRIIDFLVPGTSDSYVVSNIYDTFLEGNSTTNYADGQVMDNAVCRKIASRKISEDKKRALQQKHIAEKLFFGEKVIESLDKRFEQQGGLDSLLQAAKQFVADFIKPGGQYTTAETVGLSHKYVDDSLADLDAYISGISENYETLSNAIRAAIKEDAKSQPHA